MKVLIIDNTRDPESFGSADLKKYVLSSPDRTAFVRRSPEEDLPKKINGFDRIILSGSRTSALDESPWVGKLDELIQEALRESKPILGVCYGHQILNRVLGGRDLIRKGIPGEFGWTEIELMERAPLFEGLPDRFWSFSSHYEEVTTLAKGMRHLARSRDCSVQACRLEDLPVYGIQFHPEKDLASANHSFQSWKKDERRNQLLHPKSGRKFYKPDVGKLIFENFLTENA